MKSLFITTLILITSFTARAQDSTRIPTNGMFKASYGVEFPIFYDAISDKIYYERWVKKDGSVKKYYLKKRK